MNNQILSVIKSSKFIEYLEQIGVEIDLIIKIFDDDFNNENFSLFINNSEGLLSPNICIEETLFKVIFRFLNDNGIDDSIFDNDLRLDVRAIIAHSKSLIQRPKISTPLETTKGFKKPDFEMDFIRIARFEKQLNLKEYDRKLQNKITVLFEGLLPYKIDTDPLPDKLSSNHIWNGSFYRESPFIQGMCGRINLLEPAHILWMNSDILDYFQLKVDNYKNGLRAINEDNEVILEFRHWKEKLIGNGSHFVGTSSNIAKFEGSDLILRVDYYKKLEVLIPSLVFNSYILTS